MMAIFPKKVKCGGKGGLPTVSWSHLLWLLSQTRIGG